MKRTILALAIAGLSFVATAAPPPGGGPPQPIDVNVVNPSVAVTVGNSSVPVTIQNQSVPVNVMPSWTPPESIRTTGALALFIPAGADDSLSGVPLYPGTRVLTGLTLQIFSDGARGEPGICSSRISLGTYTSSDYVAGESLGAIATNSGGDAAIFVPLPNVYVDAGDSRYLVMTNENTTSAGCRLTAYAHGVSAE